jgi:hypothetical protein
MGTITGILPGRHPAPAPSAKRMAELARLATAAIEAWGDPENKLHATGPGALAIAHFLGVLRPGEVVGLLAGYGIGDAAILKQLGIPTREENEAALARGREALKDGEKAIQEAEAVLSRTRRQ